MHKMGEEEELGVLEGVHRLGKIADLF